MGSYFDFKFDPSVTTNEPDEATKAYEALNQRFAQELEYKAQEQAKYDADPVGYMEQEKARRVAEKEARMMPLKDLRVPDIDNLSANNGGEYDPKKNFRLTGSDMGFDGYETKKSPEWFNSLPPKAQEAYARKLNKQMLALDRAMGLPAGTSTLDDVYAKGAEQQDMLNSVIDAELIKNPDARVEFVPTGKKDKSGGQRNIVKPMLNGINLVDQYANDPKQNAAYYETFNERTNLRKKELDSTKATRYIGKDELTDEEAKTNLGHLKQGITRVKAGVVDIGSNTLRTIANRFQDKKDALYGTTARDKAMAREIKLNKEQGIELDQNEKDFEAGKNYEFPTWDAKYGKNSPESKKKKGFLDKAGDAISDTIGVATGSKQLDTTLGALGKAFGLQNNKNRVVEAKKANNLDDFKEALMEHDGRTIRKDLNTTQDRIEAAKGKRSAIEHAKNYDAIKKAFNKHDIIGTLEGIAKDAKTWGKDAGNAISNPGYSVEHFMGSVPHMAMNMTVAGTAINFANTLDDMDYHYKKNHGGKSATGMHKVGQMALSASIVAVQKGTAEVMLGGLATKMGFKPVTIKSKYSSYKAYVPESLSKIKAGEASAIRKITPKMEKTIDNFFNSAAAKVAFSKNKTLNSIAKGLGTTSYGLAKRMFYGSMALGVNAGRVSTGMGAEYGEEFIESVLGDLGNNIGTDKSIDLMKGHMAGLMGAVGGYGGKLGTVGIRAPKEGLVSFATKSLYTGNKVTDTSPFSSIIYENDTAQNNITGNARFSNGKGKTTGVEAPIPGQTIDVTNVHPDIKFDPEKGIDKYTGENSPIDDLIANPHKVGNAGEVVNEQLISALEHQTNKVKNETNEDVQLDEYEKLVALKDKYDKFTKSQADYVSNIDKPTKDKTVEEYDELDVATELISGELDAETIKKLESRGVLSKQAKLLNEALAKAHDNKDDNRTSVTNQSIRVTGIKDADGNTSKKSLAEYTTALADAAKKGDIKEARRLLKTLSRFSKIHSDKSLKFGKAAAKGQKVKWSTYGRVQEFTEKAVMNLAPVIAKEAELIEIHKALAEHIIASTELRQKRRESAQATVTTENDASNKVLARLKELLDAKKSGENSTNTTPTDSNSSTGNTTNDDNGNTDDNGSTGLVATLKKNIAKVTGKEGSRLDVVKKTFSNVATAIIGHSNTTKGLMDAGLNVVKDTAKLTSKDVLGVVMPRAYGSNATLKTQEEFKAKVAEVRNQVKQAIGSGVNTIILNKTDKSALPDGSNKGNTRLDVTLRKAGFTEDKDVKGLWTRNESNKNSSNKEEANTPTTKETEDTRKGKPSPVGKDQNIEDVANWNIGSIEKLVDKLVSPIYEHSPEAIATVTSKLQKLVDGKELSKEGKKIYENLIKKLNTAEKPGQNDPTPNTTDPATLLAKDKWGDADISDAKGIIENADALKEDAKAKGPQALLKAITQIKELKAKLESIDDNSNTNNDSNTNDNTNNDSNTNDNSNTNDSTTDDTNNDDNTNKAPTKSSMTKKAKRIIKLVSKLKNNPNKKNKKLTEELLKDHAKTLLALLMTKVDKDIIVQYKKAMAVLGHEVNEDGSNPTGNGNSKVPSPFSTSTDFSKIEHGDDFNATEDGILTEEYVIDQINKAQEIIGDPDIPTSSVSAKERAKRTTTGEIYKGGSSRKPANARRAHNAKKFLEADIRNGKELVEWLLANGATNTRAGSLDKILMKGVLKYFNTIGRIPLVKIEYVERGADGKLVNTTVKGGRVTPGTYTVPTNTITIRIYKEGITNVVYSTGLHESIHAATAQALTQDKKLKAEVRALMDRINEIVPPEDQIDKSKEHVKRIYYGLKNEFEFLAELSNPEFREFLAQLPSVSKKTYKDYSGVFGNALKIFHKVMKIVLKDKYVDENMLLEALAIYDKASLNSLRSDQDIATSMFELNVKGAILGSGTQKAISFAENLAMKFRDINRVGALGLFHNALGKIDVLTRKYGLTSKQITFLHKVRAFSANQRQAILDTVGVFDPKITSQTKYLNNKELLAIANGDLANLSDNWFHAIATQSVRFLAEEVNRMRINNYDEIRKMFSLGDGAKIDPLVANNLFNAGMKMSIVAEDLGRNIANELNISPERYAKDPAVYEKLIMDLGTVALIGMEKMGMVTFNPVYQNYINKLLPKDRQSKEIDSYTMFVSPVMEHDVNTNSMVPTKVLAEVQQMYRDNDGANALAAISAEGNNDQDAKVQDEPITENDVPKRIKRTFMKAPKKFIKSIVAASKMRWEINTTRFNRWNNIDTTVQQEILGIRNEDDHLDIYAESIKGKNTSIMRSIERLSNFVADRATKGTLDKSFSLIPTIWSQMRMGYREKDINFQQDKLHRQMVVGSDWYTELDTKSEKDMESFEQTMQVRLGKSWKDFVNEDGSFVHKDFVMAAKVLNGDRTGKSASRAVAKALDTIGEDIEGFAILTNLVDLAVALKEGGKFTSSLYAEPDGNTNGSITSSMQTVLDRHDENFRRATEAGGIFSEGSMFDNFTEHKKNNLDNYQDIIKRMAEELRKKMPKLERKYGKELINAFNMLDAMVLAPMTEKGDPNAITSEGRKWAKPFVMTFIYSKQAKSMNQDTINILEEAIYAYIDKNQDNKEALAELDKALETLNKASSYKTRLPNLVKLHESGNIKSIMLPDMGKLLAPMSTALRGDPVVKSLEESYESLVKVRNLMNTGFLAAYHYGATIYKLERDRLIRKKALQNYNMDAASALKKGPSLDDYMKNTQLSKAEDDALMADLIKKGLMPTLKHASSTSHEDSLLINNTRKVDTGIQSLVPLKNPMPVNGLYDIEANGEPVYKKHVSSVTTKSREGMVRRTTEGVNVLTNNVRRRELSAEGLGFRKFVNTVLSFDGNVQSRAMLDKVIGTFGNIHDAIIVPGHRMNEATVSQNKNYINLMAEWDMLEESLDTMLRMQQAKEDYITAYPDSAVDFNNIPVMQKKGDPIPLSEILTTFEPMVKKHLKQKLLHLKELTTVEQFEAYQVGFNAANDKAFQELVDNKIIEAENKYGIDFTEDEFDADTIEDEAYVEAISYKGQDYFVKQANHPVGDINPATVEENFEALRAIDKNHGSRMSDSHSYYLQGLVQEMSHHLKAVADGIKLEVYKGKSKVSNVAKVKASRNTIKLSVSDGLGIADNRAIESNQEAFARGYIEAIVNNAVKANSTLQSDLANLFNNIIDNKEITWKDLLYEKEMEHYTYEAKVLAEKLAKNRFDEIFFEKNLGKFVGLVLTNEKVIKKLSDINPNSNYSSEANLTPFQRVNNALLTAKDTISNKTTNDVMKNALAEALNTKNAFNTKLSNFHPFSDELNSKVHQVAKKQLYDRAVNAVNKIDPNHSFFNKRTLLHKAASPIKAIGSLAVISVDVYHNPALVEYYVDIAKDISKGLGEFLNNMKLEFIGQTPKNAKFHHMLRQVKHHVDAQQNVIASGTTQQLRNAFLKENIPTREQWGSLTRSVLKTDLGVVFGNYDLAESLNIIENKNSILAEKDLQMDKIKEVLPSAFHKGIETHINGLAHFMRTKENRVEGLRANAYEMAIQFLKASGTEISAREKKHFIRAIDIAVTTQALSEVSKSDLKTLNTLMRAEASNPNHGVVMLAEMQQAGMEMHRNMLHRPQAKRIKGDLRQTITNNYQTVVVEAKKVEAMKQLGYKVYTDATANKTDNVIMYTNQTSYSKHITGIVSLSSDNYGKTVGHTPDTNINLKRAKFDKKTNYPLVAAMSNGKHEEIIHTPEALYQLSGSEMDASILVGNDIAYSTTTSKAKKYNKEAVKALYEDYNVQRKNEDNRLINFNSETHPDLWNTLPYEFKKDLISKFGDEKLIKIDRDYITLVFGFKTRSIANLVDNKHETSKKILFHAENIWQKTVARAKEHVVIYTPGVLKANVMSNAVLSVVQGVPPVYMLKEQKNALKAVSGYRRTLAKRDDVARLLKMKNNKNDKFLKKKLDKYNSLLKDNIVHKLVEEGVFTSYIEDIDNRDAPILGAVDEAIGDFRKDGANTITRDFVGKGANVPYVGAAYKNLVIAKDTNLAKDLRYATQVSDFVARYAMYKYRTEVQKKGHAETIDEVMETFINYEWNTSNELQWINDMGILMYTKFLFRIQKVIFKSFRDRPINNAASLILQNALGDVPDITDGFITGAFSDGRMNSPLKIVDDAFELNLLHYLPFFG